MISTSLYCNAYFGIFKASLGFNMAHFEAYFNFMIVGITNKYVFNLKFTEILQTDVQERLEGKSIFITYLLACAVIGVNASIIWW